LRDIGYLEANCYIYWLGASDRKNLLARNLFSTEQKVPYKLYYVFRKLLEHRHPGSFFVRTFSFDDDPALSSFGPDPMDMLGFSSENKTVVLLPTLQMRPGILQSKALQGQRCRPSVPSAQRIWQIRSQVIIGEHSTVYLPEHSVILMETKWR